MVKNKPLLLAIFTVVLFGIIADANQAGAVAVSPVLIEHDMAPGMQISGKIRVSNLADATQSYYTSVMRFVPIGEEGRQEYMENKDDITAFADWFTFAESVYTVDPKSTTEVDYTITAPLDAEPGGHYGAVFFALDSGEMQKETTGSNISSKTGILFLIKIAGDINESAGVESFFTNKNIYSHLPVNFLMRVKNTGNVHLRPNGTVEIKNIFGGVVARVSANPANSAVLPNSIRKVSSWWNKTNDPPLDGFFSGFSSEWKNFAFGRYTAELNVRYGSSGKQLQYPATSFWVIPWRIILATVVLVAILFIAMKLYNKAIINSAIGKSVKKRKRK